MTDPTKKRETRRKNHIAKDLRTPKYRARVVPVRKDETDEERRFRRYRMLDYLKDLGEN